MLRQSLLLAAATVAFAGAGQAQTRGQSRDDLLDALTRHIQICGEITDTPQRLSCYDRLQTQVGGVSAPAQPTPTPLQAAPANPPVQPPPGPAAGSSINSAPLPSQAPSPQPLVTLGAANLTYGDSRYWQVSVTLTSNTQRPLSTQAECTFMNGGRPVASDYLGPVMIQPGEQISTELIGPPTTTYVDSTNCKVLSP